MHSKESLELTFQIPINAVSQVRGNHGELCAKMHEITL